jgi:hypothetical protein
VKPVRHSIQLRTTADEKLAWQAQADAEGVSLSDMIRTRVNAMRAAVSPVVVLPSARSSSDEVESTPARLAALAAPPAARGRLIPCEHNVPPWSHCAACDERGKP